MNESTTENDRTSEQVASLKYGFIPRGLYVHTTKHCNILDVTFNSKKNQYVVLDSRGVSTWFKSNKYNYYNRLKDFDAYKFNLLNCVTYNRSVNLYFCLTKDYGIKVFNMNFIEILSIDTEGTTTPKLAYDSKSNELVTISRKKVQFWKLSIVDSSRIGEGFRLLREYNVPSSSLITNAEYDEEFQFVYLISHNEIWCYNVDMTCFTRFEHSKYICSSFKICTFLHQSNVFVTGTSNGEIPVYSYGGALIVTLRKHTRTITSILPHPHDPSLFITSSLDGNIKIFSLQIYDEIYSISVFPDGIKWMYLQSAFTLYCASQSSVSVFDINHICSFWSTVRCPVNNINVYSKRDGKTSHIVVQDTDKCIRIYSKSSSEKICTVLPPPEMLTTYKVPSYSYDRIGKIVYILYNKRELWIYLTRTDPATRVNIWNIQNILEREVADIKDPDQSNDLDDFGIGLFRKRNAKGDVVCMCTETISRHLYQMNEQLDPTKPDFDLLMCGMSNGKVYFLDPSPPLSVTLGFVAHPTSPILELRTVYDDSSLTVIRILSLIQSKPYHCVKIWNAYDFSLLGSIDINTDVTVYSVKSYIFVCGDRNGYLRVEGLDENSLSEINENEDVNCHHLGKIISVDVLPSKELICSCGSDDFYVRVWNFQKYLITEIRLDETLCYASFLNSSGSLLVGFQSHLYTVSREILYPADVEEEDMMSNDDDLESVVYEDPQMKRNCRKTVEFITNDIDNYLIPYPYLSLESNWMYQNEIHDESEVPEEKEGDEKSRSSTPGSVYADSEIYADTVCSSLSDDMMNIEMPRCGDSPEGDESRESHSSINIPSDEQRARVKKTKKYELPITRVVKKTSILQISGDDGTKTSSSIEVRIDKSHNKANKGATEGQKTSNKKSKQMSTANRKNPNNRKGKPEVVIRTESPVESIEENISEDTIDDSTSGETILFYSSSETMGEITSGDTIEDFMSCYTSEVKTIIPDISNIPSIESEVHLKMNPSIIITTATPELPSDTSSEQVQEHSSVEKTRSGHGLSQKESQIYKEYSTAADVVAKLSKRRIVSQSYRNVFESMVGDKESKSTIESTCSSERAIDNTVFNESRSSFDIEHDQWGDIPCDSISMSPSGRHYTKGEIIFSSNRKKMLEDEAYYNLQSNMKSVYPGGSISSQNYPLDKVKAEVGSFSEHCQSTSSNNDDEKLIPNKVSSSVERKSTQQTLNNSESDEILKLFSISLMDTVKKENSAIKNIPSNVYRLAATTSKSKSSKMADKSRERVMVLNRVKRQSIQYNSKNDFVSGKSVFNSENTGNPVNEKINKREERALLIAHSISNVDVKKKIEHSKSDEHCEIERVISIVSQENGLPIDKNVDEAKSEEVVKNTNDGEVLVKSEESMTERESVGNDFFFEVNITRPRQKRFPQLEPIDQENFKKLNSIYTKELMKSLQKTSLSLLQNKKKKKEKEDFVALHEELQKMEKESSQESTSCGTTEEENFDVSVDVKIRGRGITKMMIPGSYHLEQKLDSHIVSEDEQSMARRVEQKEIAIIGDKIREEENELIVPLIEKRSENIFTRTERITSIAEKDENDLIVPLIEKRSENIFTRTERVTSIAEKDDVPDSIDDMDCRNEQLEQSSVVEKSEDIFEDQPIECHGNRKELTTNKQKSDHVWLTVPTLVADDEKDGQLMANEIEESHSISAFDSSPHQVYRYGDESNNFYNKRGEREEMDIERSIRIVSKSNKSNNTPSYHEVGPFTKDYLKSERMKSRIKEKDLDKSQTELRKDLRASALYDYHSMIKKDSVSPELMHYYFKSARNSPESFYSNSLSNSPECNRYQENKGNDSPVNRQHLSSSDAKEQTRHLNVYHQGSRLSSGYGTHSPYSNKTRSPTSKNSENKSKKRLSIKSSPIYLENSINKIVYKKESNNLCSEKVSVLLSKDERLTQAKKLESKLSGQSYRSSKAKRESESADDKVRYMFLQSKERGREYLRSNKTRTVSIPNKKTIDWNS